MLEAVDFIAGPVYKKDKAVISILLQHCPHLWDYDRYFSLLFLMKSVCWTEGLITALSSATAHKLFYSFSLKDRFRFVRDHLSLAFRLLPEYEMNFDAHTERATTIINERKSLAQPPAIYEKVDMREQIRQRLA